MWATLALAAVLQAIPSQNAFAVKNARCSYGLNGPTRKDAKFLPGDVLVLSYELQNLSKKNGVVEYTLDIEIASKAGKSIYKFDKPKKFTSELTLGGNARPNAFVYQLPFDTAAGAYVLTINGTDERSKQSDKLDFPFEVLSRRLGFIQTGFFIPGNNESFPAPTMVPLGQPLVLSTSVVGFEMGPKDEKDITKKQPHLVIVTTIFDENGKATLAEPQTGGVLKIREEYKQIGLVPFTTLIECNRAGKFKVHMKAMDKIANTETEMTIDLTVYEIK